MSTPADENEQPPSLDARPATVAELYVLARLSRWDVREWRPKSDGRPALLLLDDPSQSSVNPGVATRLIDAGLVEALNGGLTVTPAGAGALLERPDLMVRMRASGAI